MLLSCTYGLLSKMLIFNNRIQSLTLVPHCLHFSPVGSVSLSWPSPHLFCPTEQDHPGPSDIQRGSFPALSGGALGEHHQRCRANGRLIVHTRRPARTHRGRVQRRSTGPSRLVERVHEQCEFPLLIIWHSLANCICTHAHLCNRNTYCWSPLTFPLNPDYSDVFSLFPALQTTFTSHQISSLTLLMRLVQPHSTKIWSFCMTYGAIFL